MRNALTALLFTVAISGLVVVARRGAPPTAPDDRASLLAHPRPRKPGARLTGDGEHATSLPSGVTSALAATIPPGAQPMPAIIPRPSAPVGPRGTYVAIAYGGDGQGEVEPCG